MAHSRFPPVIDELSRARDLLAEVFDQIGPTSADLRVRIAVHIERIEVTLKRVEETKRETT